LLTRAVPDVHDAGGVDREDGQRRRLHDRAQGALAAAAGGVDRAPIADVAGERREVLVAAVGAAVARDLDRRGGLGSRAAYVELARPAAARRQRLADLVDLLGTRLEEVVDRNLRKRRVRIEPDRRASRGVREQHAPGAGVEGDEVGRRFDRATKPDEL